MKSAGPSSRAVWAISGIAAALATGVFALLFRLPSPPPKPATDRTPHTVAVAQTTDENRLFAEQAIMRDNAPLFLPTEWNVTIPEPEPPKPGRALVDDEPIPFIFPDTRLDVAKQLPLPGEINGKPIAQASAADFALAQPPLPLSGFGRQPVPVEPLPARGGWLEIFHAATGEIVRSEPLPPDARPATAKPWQPLEFILAVNVMGAVGPLQLVNGSGAEEADLHFQRFLTQTYRLAERLTPGFYRITVSP